jgi:hypothetical protein
MKQTYSTSCAFVKSAYWILERGTSVNLLQRFRINTSQKSKQRNGVYTKDDSIQAIAATHEVPRRLENFAACTNLLLFFAEN